MKKKNLFKDLKKRKSFKASLRLFHNSSKVAHITLALQPFSFLSKLCDRRAEFSKQLTISLCDFFFCQNAIRHENPGFEIWKTAETRFSAIHYYVVV